MIPLEKHIKSSLNNAGLLPPSSRSSGSEMASFLCSGKSSVTLLRFSRVPALSLSRFQSHRVALSFRCETSRSDTCSGTASSCSPTHSPPSRRGAHPHGAAVAARPVLGMAARRHALCNSSHTPFGCCFASRLFAARPSLLASSLSFS